MDNEFSKLKRQRYPMPVYVKQMLEERGVMQDYRQRPPYQQNDYIGWIESAKRPDTRDKRLRQMIDELKRGGVYMNMKHSASQKT